MKQYTNTINIMIGAIVIIISLFLLVRVYFVVSADKLTGLRLIAIFDRADGLFRGSNVKLNGVKVGRIENISLDEEHNAVVKIVLQEGLSIPNDSIAAIEQEGLFGGAFIAIEVGGASPNNFRSGDKFAIARSPVSILQMVRTVYNIFMSNSSKLFPKT